MSIAKTLFVAIDKVFEPKQNPRALQKKLSDVQCVKDIMYDEKFSQALDLYFMPREGKPYPVIFEIHGGGFAAGDKMYRDCYCRFLAKRTGAMVVNVNYGVGTENPCPLPMWHLASAVNWVYHNASKYNLDMTKFVVTGDSAGAFYACVLAVLQDDVELQKLFECKFDARITATVLNCGVYDLTAYLHKHSLLFNSICKEFLGESVKQATDNKYLDGVNLLRRIGENFPPSFVIYAQKDIFCKGQGEQLVEKLQERQVPVEYVFSTTLLANHTYSLVWSKIAQQTNAQMINFLKKHFEA